MSERVHSVTDSPPIDGKSSRLPQKSASPPPSYVIQVPKDQIYKYPPPENVRRQHQKSHVRRRSCCCCCCCWILTLLMSLIIALAIAAGVLYLVFRPKVPKYSVENLSIKGFNLSLSSNQTSLSLSPEIDVTVRADNPNEKIGISYENGSAVSVIYSDVTLGKGALPVFYQGSKNVTVFRTSLKGDGVVLTRPLSGTIVGQQKEGQIPLDVDLSVPVKVKFGAVKTWKITVVVKCGLVVDKLTEKSKIVSQTCKVKVNF